MSAIKMLSKDEEKDVQVTWQDQQLINEFSRLNAKESDASANIAKHITLIEDLEELSNELELSDESDPVLYKIGDSFITLEASNALERVSTEKDTLEKTLSDLKQEQTRMKARMEELKTLLYAKFGSAINLER